MLAGSRWFFARWKEAFTCCNACCVCARSNASLPWVSEESFPARMLYTCALPAGFSCTPILPKDAGSTCIKSSQALRTSALMAAHLSGEMVSAWQMCNAFCWIEVVPLAHTKMRFCISAGSSARTLCGGAASAAGARVINKLTNTMIVAPRAAEFFTKLNQCPGNCISLHRLPFPKFALQPILLRTMHFQIRYGKNPDGPFSRPDDRGSSPQGRPLYKPLEYMSIEMAQKFGHGSILIQGRSFTVQFK